MIWNKVLRSTGEPCFDAWTLFAKAEEIHGTAKELVPVLPKDDFTKQILKRATEQLYAVSNQVIFHGSLMLHVEIKLSVHGL